MFFPHARLSGTGTDPWAFPGAETGAASPPAGSAAQSGPVRGPRGAGGRLHGVGSRRRFACLGSDLMLAGRRRRRRTMFWCSSCCMGRDGSGVLALFYTNARSDGKLQ